MKAENLLLVLDGTVRVQQVSEGGQEIVLYRVTQGETCIMTLACLLAHDDYSAEGIAETDVQAVGVPRPAFEDFMGRSSAFRRFVFASYSSRLRELFNIINDVAFARIDVRLAKKLPVRPATSRLLISSWRSNSAVRERSSVANFRSSSVVVGSRPNVGTLVSLTADRSKVWRPASRGSSPLGTNVTKSQTARAANHLRRAYRLRTCARALDTAAEPPSLPVLHDNSRAHSPCAAACQKHLFVVSLKCGLQVC